MNLNVKLQKFVVFLQQNYFKIKFTGILIFNLPSSSSISDGGLGKLKDFKTLIVVLYNLFGFFFQSLYSKYFQICLKIELI